MQVHVHRNILSSCKKYFKDGKQFEFFLGVWQRLVDARNEIEFNMRYNSILSTYSTKYPKVISYICTTWLEPFNEPFVCAWIENYMHLDNSTTNRVEGGHSKLKKFLEVLIGNLATIWKVFDQMLCLQHTKIKRSFGHSSIQVINDFKGSLYSNLVGRVSVQAL